MKKDKTIEEAPRMRKKKWPLITAIGVGVFVVVLLAIAGWFTHGTVEATYQQSSVAVDAPIDVKLSQRLLQIPLDRIAITPEVKGTWTLERSLSEGDTLRFTQREPFVAGTTYTVTLQEVRRVTGIEVAISPITFETETAPGIAEVSFGEGATLAADASFNVTLSAKNRNLRDLHLQTNPKLALTHSSRDDTVFTWKAEKLLPQGKKITLTLVDKKTDTVLVTRHVLIAPPPQVVNRPPETNFGKQDTATITFKQAIDHTSGTIRFSAAGNGVWRDDKTYVFTPTSVTPGTTYTYVIPKGLRTKDGGIVEKAQTYRFSTPGAVAVVGFSPYGQELSQKQQTIRVSFNQPVDKRSAEARVVLSRGTIQSRTWDGNTLVLTATNFGVQQTVYITVQAGVQPIFGLTSTQGYGHSFTTEVPTKRLNVPMYYQQHAQSCESASLRMALAYKGKYVGSDMTILRQFGYSPRPLDKKNNVWDDPELQFVGDVNGNQGAGTGWGVYAQPVAKAARYFGRGAEARYGVSASFVAQNIYKGNPVILWGIWDESATQKSWKTPGGRKVSGPIPMHVRLIVGVKGSVDKPVGFYVHDPITGPTYWTADYMVYNAQRAGAANMAVAVQ